MVPLVLAPSHKRKTAEVGGLSRLGGNSAEGDEKIRVVENDRPSVRTSDALVVKFTRLEIHWDRRPSF